MQEQVKESGTATSHKDFIWRILAAIVGKSILAQILQIWFSKPVSRGTAFFVAFGLLSWIDLKQRPIKLRLLMLLITLVAAIAISLAHYY
jgi:hypothetical protein